MNLLQLHSAARAAYNTARTICAAPAWETLDSTARASWVQRFQTELTKGAIVAQEVTP